MNNAPWSRLRLRRTEHLRDMLAETSFGSANLIQPVFVVDGMTGSEPVPGLGETARHGPSDALRAIARDVAAGVRHYMLFSVPSEKGTHGLSFRHLGRAVSAIKKEFGDAVHLWVDICLCSSTSHGHCAILDEAGGIDLDATLDALGQAAAEAADAGADGVAPSDMMDGRVAHIRGALDAAGHRHVPIMSYSTKFASQFYGPFRGAADSAPQHGNRRHYQIDVRSRLDAIGSSIRCAEEGADLLMVKPAMTSIDLIAPIVEATGVPTGAFQVSGEYAGLLALAEKGFADFDAALLETLYVLRRAGAAFIVTYGARKARALGLP
ncbi:MAG: porphobilinogen synthase [Acidobacteriota bacterium]|jgi:porphobilinogen synthase|nr:MAG: porphobilinogen synthase [Acidobacteriota bacterium]